MSFISSCWFTSQAPRGSVCASPEEAGGLVLDAQRHQQRRADVQLREARRFRGLLLARAGGVAQLREPQVLEARAQPREGLERGAAEGLGAALCEGAARRLHLGDLQRIGGERDEEGAVGAARAAQQLEIALQALVDALAAHVLEVDGDLGADHVHAQDRLGSAPSPGVRRKDV